MNTRTRAADEIDADPVTGARPGAAPVGDIGLLPLVDAALTQMLGRGSVGSIEVVDLLLDLRSRIVLEHALGPAAQDQSTKEH